MHQNLHLVMWYQVLHYKLIRVCAGIVMCLHNGMFQHQPHVRSQSMLWRPSIACKIVLKTSPPASTSTRMQALAVRQTCNVEHRPEMICTPCSLYADAYWICLPITIIIGVGDFRWVNGKHVKQLGALPEDSVSGPNHAGCATWGTQPLQCWVAAAAQSYVLLQVLSVASASVHLQSVPAYVRSHAPSPPPKPCIMVVCTWPDPADCSCKPRCNICAILGSISSDGLYIFCLFITREDRSKNGCISQ